jgi:hypothetical protein
MTGIVVFAASSQFLRAEDRQFNARVMFSPSSR